MVAVFARGSSFSLSVRSASRVPTATRHEDDFGMPRVVVYQIDEEAPLNPRGLLVAYEEHGHVLPVASDFDAFLIGAQSLQISRHLPIDDQLWPTPSLSVRGFLRARLAWPRVPGD